jgi:hypothetical protein
MKRMFSLLVLAAAVCASSVADAHGNDGVYGGAPGYVYAAPPPIFYRSYWPPANYQPPPVVYAPPGAYYGYRQADGDRRRWNGNDGHRGGEFRREGDDN